MIRVEMIWGAVEGLDIINMVFVYNQNVNGWQCYSTNENSC